jgi:hypothetical protein
MIEIRQTTSARAIRQVTAIQLPEPRVETVKKLQERYGFMKIPSTFEELFPSDPNQGIKFAEGKFDRNGQTVVIQLLQLLPNIILAETRTSTDDADAFLDDYIQQANQNRNDIIKIVAAPIYNSQIEFSMKHGLEEFTPTAAKLGAQLNSLVAGYGTPMQSYRVISIAVNHTLVGLGGIQPAHFSIERRSGIPYDADLYFSNAPLKTRDHIALLKSLDPE